METFPRHFLFEQRRLYGHAPLDRTKRLGLISSGRHYLFAERTSIRNDLPFVLQPPWRRHQFGFAGALGFTETPRGRECGVSPIPAAWQAPAGFRRRS